MKPKPGASEVRVATVMDMAAVTDIYRHHVLHGLASFEITPPVLDEMQRRRTEVIASNLPYLVATVAGTVVGYAYAAAYRARPAYRYTVEDSIYVHPGYVGRGLGARLMPELILGCEQAGCRQMIAVIGDSKNLGSINLHRRFGFALIGVLPAVGYKFGRWVDSVLMQRSLGQGDASAPV